MPKLKTTSKDTRSALSRARVPGSEYFYVQMLWPDDPKKMADVVYSHAALELFVHLQYACHTSPAKVTMYDELAHMLVVAPSRTEFFRDRLRRCIHGTVVGTAVLSVLSNPKAKLDGELGAEGENIKKVLPAEVEKYRSRVAAHSETANPWQLAEELEMLARGPMAIQLDGPSLLTNVWPKFRPAAHLWAALCRNRLWAKEPSFPLERDERLLAFLVAAAYLKGIGARHRLRNGGKLFDADKMFVGPPARWLPEPPEELVSAFPPAR